LAGVETVSSEGGRGEPESLDGDLSGGPAVGDSKTTFVGVALTLNDRSGESATLVGGSDTRGLLAGDSTGADVFAVDTAILGSFLGDPSPGISETRLLRRRTALLSI
jgi:hypothetical protein